MIHPRKSHQPWAKTASLRGAKEYSLQDLSDKLTKARSIQPFWEAFLPTRLSYGQFVSVAPIFQQLAGPHSHDPHVC